MARADQLQRQRKIDGYAVAAIAPVIALIPAWLIAVAAFWWAFVQFYYVPFALFASALFLSGGLLFVRPIQRLALQRLLERARQREQNATHCNVLGTSWPKQTTFHQESLFLLSLIQKT